MKKIYLIFTFALMLFVAFGAKAQPRVTYVAIGQVSSPPVFFSETKGNIYVGDTIHFYLNKQVTVRLRLDKFPGDAAPLDTILNESTTGRASGKKYVPTKDGNYTVETDQFGKPSFSFTVLPATVTSTETSASYEGVSFSPNPVKDEMNVTLNSSFTYEISISDMIGSKLITKTVTNSSNAALNTSSLPKGAYVLHLSTDAGSKPKAFKFVKE